MKYIPFFLFIALAALAQQPSVDFISVHGNLTVQPEKRMVSGEVMYEFEVLKSVDTLKIDAKQMTFSDVRVDGKQVKHLNSGAQLLLPGKFKKGSSRLTFSYSATPKQTMYFIGWDGNMTGNQVWTQGQGKYTSHWFPSFDDENEKVIFNISASFDQDYTVLANGLLKNTTIKDNVKTWHYSMQKPMSSYLLMMVIGKYVKHSKTAVSETPLEFYIEPDDVDKFEPTYRYSKRMFDFLEQEIGVRYPWDVYRQVPVRDFLYAGMENTTATVFAQDFVVDSIGFNDRNYVNVNAHELAHQWFGDMVTAKSGTHHWLQEGFATYYALLAEKEVFGDDYFHWKLYEMAENLQQAATTDTIPVLNAKASSLTFYQKGAWALHVLRKEVGEQKFRTAVRNYLEKYKFRNVDTDEFLAEINKVSTYDTEKFSNTWLLKPGFEVADAIRILSENSFMKQYFDSIGQANTPLNEKKGLLQQILASDAYHPLKEEVIFQTQQYTFEEKESLIQMAMRSDHYKVRQAVAKTVNPVPEDFRAEYETLLDDPSYVTQEIALNILWSQFEAQQSRILDKMDGRIGMNDKNIRILWLTMALITADYNNGKKVDYYDELLAYTKPPYESAVRMNAIESLLFVNKNDTAVLESLARTLVHHKWQLTRFGRDKIRELITNPAHRTFYENLLPTLDGDEKTQLDRLLNPKS
ncbi:MAG: M1 family metallopeptidase [Flavobacterium sp.]|nr:M1 family metallopeptidase [Flavobacterium sp.]